MILRVLFVVGLIILFTVPLYKIFKRLTLTVKSEVEEEGDAESRLVVLKQKQKKLKADCADIIRLEERKKRAAEQVKNKL